MLLGNELRKLRRGSEVARLTLPESPGSVWSLSEDSQGNLWISSSNRGFTRVTAGGALTR
ncbi:MAG: two-component regulator propeller domain-containing protein [Limisphaerales bacterium]